MPRAKKRPAQSRLRRRLSQRMRRARNAVSDFNEKFGPVWPAVLVLVLLVAALAFLRQANWASGDIAQGVYVEAWGSVLDVFLVGIILALFARGHDRRERIHRYLEEIDDFKKWDSHEGRLRILGNIRRSALADIHDGLGTDARIASACRSGRSNRDQKK